MNVTKILITQAEPIGTSPYTEVIEKHKLIVDHLPFVRVESVSSKEFRANRIDILKHTAVVFTTRSAADIFFQLCEELRVQVPESMKYFCMTESIANYLQKYIVYRKRKIFFGEGTVASLIEAIGVKHKYELFLFVLADKYKPDIPKAFDKARLKNTKAVFYRTVTNTDLGLTETELKRYDMLVFYSPGEVRSLVENFPNFKQTRALLMASYGAATAKELKAHGFKVAIEAPTPQAPSIAKALDLFLSQSKKK